MGQAGRESFRMRRERRPVLEGLELRLRERVVDGDVRSGTIYAQDFGSEGWATNEAPFTVYRAPIVRFVAGDFVVPPVCEIQAAWVDTAPDEGRTLAVVLVGDTAPPSYVFSWMYPWRGKDLWMSWTSGSVRGRGTYLSIARASRICRAYPSTVARSWEDVKRGRARGP